MGVIETAGWSEEAWYGSDYNMPRWGGLEGLLVAALHKRLGGLYRYREGKRAVMLWPEERMGEVVEL